VSSRSLADLHPLFRPKAEEFVAASTKAGLDVLIYCTFRYFVDQAELYAQGRTKPGKIVTKAKPGESAHNYGLAFDGAPLIHGRIAWDDHAHWVIYGQIATDVGLEWAGNWKGDLIEMPHVQLPNWKEHRSASWIP
jgi:peptidoglycan L-alanyl-D-glutamate endopeptidase CwlK